MKEIIEHYDKLVDANLNLIDEFETEHAYIIVSKKPSPVGEGGPSQVA